MIRILVKVTREILERSAMCGFDDKTPSWSHCAISLAVQDIFPKCHTYNYEILIHGCGCIPLPIGARIFIVAFDAASPDFRRSMSPISFEIEVPEAVIEKIGLGEIYKILSESRTLELASPNLLNQE